MNRHRALVTSSLFAASLLAGCGSRHRSNLQADVSGANVPMVCALSGETLVERKELLKELTRGIVERRVLDDGVAYRFEAEPGVVTRLAQIVDLERECCQFLAFRSRVEEENGPIWLELTGPKDLIDHYFGEE